jgi:hypothetical protein
MELMPTHQVQRWKLDMLRYNFKTVHRPERTLCECNLLTRYNLYADELRRSELTQVIENNQQIEQKMMEKSGKLNTTQPKTLFFTLTGDVLTGAWKSMTQDFSAFLSCLQSRQSFSNLCPAVHGPITTQRSLIAAICDPTLVVMTTTPEGHNLIQDAMTDLGMEHSVVATRATKQYWIEELNFPNPVKLKAMLTQNLEMKVDWLWIDRTAKHSIANDFLPEIMNIVAILKDRGATTFVFLWGKAAEHWKQDMDQIANLCSTIFAGWQQLRHAIENSFCGGPVCRQTRLLLVLPVEVASFYDEAIQDESTYQEPSTGMSTCLDSSNTIYSDYLQGYTQLPSDRCYDIIC